MVGKFVRCAFGNKIWIQNEIAHNGLYKEKNIKKNTGNRIDFSWFISVHMWQKANCICSTENSTCMKLCDGNLSFFVVVNQLLQNNTNSEKETDSTRKRKKKKTNKFNFQTKCAHVLFRVPFKRWFNAHK